MDPQRPKRLIEVSFPLGDISKESVREKNIRHGHISTLHIWWARKPLAASRATTLAALLPDDPERRESLLSLIRALAPWEAVQEENSDLEQARYLIWTAFGGRTPRVFDPFAGGGSIPLEALRLGCETHALDYNPVAVLILKCVLEYPQRYAKPESVSVLPLPPRLAEEAAGPRQGFFFRETDGEEKSPLLQAVQAWGRWVLEEARQELQQFYPTDPDRSIPVGYYWMRTVPCQNPSCGAEIPLTANWWLAKKPEKKVALRLIPNHAAKRVDAEIVEEKNINFDPAEGTVTRAHVRCPLCGGTMDDRTTRRLFREGKAGQRMMAVVLHHPDRSGKHYRLPTEQDLKAYNAAEQALEEKRQKFWEEWGMDPVPDEFIPTPTGGEYKHGSLFYNFTPIVLYGFTRWGDLFNSRQKLALITFAEKVRQAHAQMLSQGADPDFAKAVVTYLALALDKLATYLCVLTRWRSDVLSFERSFDRQALPMVWDYGEVNPFSEARGSWDMEGMLEALAHLTRIPPVEWDSDG